MWVIWTKVDLVPASNFSIFEFKDNQIWIFFLLFRSIVSFAQNLSSNKDVKEVFGQLVEKPIEAFKSIGATPATVDLFLRYRISKFIKIDNFCKAHEYDLRSPRKLGIISQFFFELNMSYLTDLYIVLPSKWNPYPKIQFLA